MMDIKDKIKEALDIELKDKSWYKGSNSISSDSDYKELRGFLTEAREVFREDDGDSRWWRNETIVVKIADKYFMYGWASANRDESIFDLGWEFDWDSVIEVKPYEELITVTKYKKVINE